MGRREENKRRKLAALKQAGLEVFAREGYDRATIEAIAAYLKAVPASE